MLDFAVLRTLLKALRTVHGRAAVGNALEGRYESWGLCSMIHKEILDIVESEGLSWGHRCDVTYQWAALRDSWFATWEHSTGSEEYPVPCTNELIRSSFENVDEAGLAREQYWACSRHDYGEHGHWEGSQGELRLSLLAHCINKLTGLLPEGQAVS